MSSPTGAGEQAPGTIDGEQPRVSLLIPNRNNGPILDYVLERLAENTTYPAVELVVVDDGSTDDSIPILRHWRDSNRFTAFRLLEREHGGVIDALNAGLAAATGELVVQLDGDASVETPGWLERMVSLFMSDPRVGLLTAKVVFDWGEVHTCGVNLIGPAGFHARGSVVSEPVGRRTYHERVGRRREGDCRECESLAEVDAGSGTCMMYSRAVALELGGYDPGWAPVWFDDIDLALSIRRSGLKAFFTPDVRLVHHVGQRTAGRDESRAVAELRRLAAARLPPRTRQRIAAALRMDQRPPEVRERLEHHYAYWREKWGFDMLNPNMDEIRDRWGSTELCWQTNPEMREAGSRIIARWPRG